MEINEDFSRSQLDIGSDISVTPSDDFSRPQLTDSSDVISRFPNVELELGKNWVSNYYTYDHLWNISKLSENQFIEHIVPYTASQFRKILVELKSQDQEKYNQFVSGLQNLKYDWGDDVYDRINQEINTLTGFTLPKEFIKYTVLRKYIKDTEEFLSYDRGLIKNIIGGFSTTLSSPLQAGLSIGSFVLGGAGIKMLAQSAGLSALTTGLTGGVVDIAGATTLDHMKNEFLRTFFENPFREELGLPKSKTPSFFNEVLGQLKWFGALHLSGAAFKEGLRFRRVLKDLKVEKYSQFDENIILNYLKNISPLDSSDFAGSFDTSSFSSFKTDVLKFVKNHPDLKSHLKSVKKFIDDYEFSAGLNSRFAGISLVLSKLNERVKRFINDRDKT